MGLSGCGEPTPAPPTDAEVLAAERLRPTRPELAAVYERSCLACHGVDKPSLGPAFKAVAAKYRGQKGMDAKLAQKVLKGGGGVWNMPMGAMPPQAQVKEAEALQLTQWILSLK